MALDFSTLLMLGGFLLACYSIVANDAIQTLGTFLASNEDKPWWLLWIYAGGIMTAVLLYGWFTNGGDVAFGRLDRIPHPGEIQWWHVMPVAALLMLTRRGIPVSTTFLVLSVFSSSAVLGKVLLKSLVGYGVAFGAAALLWILVSKKLEKKFMGSQKVSKPWVAAQWISTGFLWSQWLIQDFANIFVFLPRQISILELSASITALLFMLAIIFQKKGGKIQGIVTSKTQTGDIRSATLIDFSFGFILMFFKEVNNLPMSTTWVFLGLLAGREFAISHRLQIQHWSHVAKNTSLDFAKAVSGLAVSLGIVLGVGQVNAATRDKRPKETIDQPYKNPKESKALDTSKDKAN